MLTKPRNVYLYNGTYNTHLPPLFSELDDIVTQDQLSAHQKEAVVAFLGQIYREVIVSQKRS